jgi:glycosyltransferase involved in cell wall biosynthesis
LLHDLRGGGAERVMLRLAQGFVEAGRQVDLLLVKKQGDYLNLIPAGARVVDLNKSHVLNAVPAIAAYLRRERPSVILTALTHINLAAVLARKLSFTGIRLVLTEHNQITRKVENARGLRSRVIYGLVRMLYPSADAVVAVSTGVAADLERFANFRPSTVKVIYNPVTHDGLLQQAREHEPHPWFQPGQPPVILGVGRLHRQKGFDVLLKAFQKIRATVPSRLVIAGEGAERAELEALIRSLGLTDDVALIGFVGNPFRLMARAGVFVLSSRWEGLPTVLLEAMYCGAPVVSADCPSGAAEILDDGRYGELVPVDSPDALATAIIKVLRDKPAARTDRALEYNVPRSVDAYLRLLEQHR